jgi:hypothetical protein
MFKAHRPSRPSPALIVAVTALVFAIAGTAIAGPSALSKITRGKVKTIAAKQIEEAAPGLSVAEAKKADTATNATTAANANSAKIATNIIAANVLGNGTTLGSIPAGVTSTKTATGTYTVVFPRSVAGCNLSASAGSPTSESPVLVGAAPVNGTPEAVRVFTRTSANVVADQDFYVQIICPAG